MRLKWYFMLIFGVGLISSIAFGIGAGADSLGWLAASLMSAAGLAWTWWGDPETSPSMSSNSSLKPTNPAETVPPAADAFPESPRARAAARFAAAELSSRFEEYFQRSPVPMIVLNRDGRIERMNEAAERVTEFAAAEVSTAAYWDQFLEESARPEAQAAYGHALLERAAPPRREAWKTRTGAVAHFDWWRSVLRDANGQAEAVLAVALPVAPEPAHPVDLTALADQLTTVNGYSEYLLQNVRADDPIRGDLEQIHRAGKAATQSLRK